MKFDDEKLIQCVRKFPSVYNRWHGDFRNKELKKTAWATISEHLGVSEDLCEHRWETLRNRYAGELRKNRNKNTPDVRITWRHAESMSFLEKYIYPRRTRDRKPSVESNFEMNGEILTPSRNVPSVPPDTLVAVEMGSHTKNVKLRPIAPRPSVPTFAGLVTVPKVPNMASIGNHSNSASYTKKCESKECQEMEDEDILFGKSVGYTLKSIRNNKIKLEVKGKMLEILAKNVE